MASWISDDTTDRAKKENAEGPQALSDHQVLGALVTSLVQGNRRLQMVVFPSLFAFVLLASYGFFLIYNHSDLYGIM